jgi:hypothetical protein
MTAGGSHEVPSAGGTLADVCGAGSVPLTADVSDGGSQQIDVVPVFAGQSVLYTTVKGAPSPQTSGGSCTLLSTT